jgi:hypothetical protein
MEVIRDTLMKVACGYGWRSARACNPPNPTERKRVRYDNFLPCIRQEK